LNFVIIYHYYI